MYPARFLKPQLHLSNGRQWSPLTSVLFSPDGYDSEAKRTSRTLEHLYGPTSATLEARPKKISLILQNQEAQANGFVSYSPRRSEFFTMPPQNYNLLGTLDWNDLLSVHEFRHVAQFDAMNVGFNRFVYTITGQSGYALMASLAAPRWYWEGDAVVSETAQTLSGRGRIPAFGLEYKTNLLEMGKFNYHKQHLRSFKHFIPNHYRLGWYMNSYLRNKYDEQTIRKVIDRSSRKSWMPFTFSNSLKRVTGKHLVTHYNEMMDDLESRYEGLTAGLEFTESTQINSRKNKAWTNFMFPQLTSSGDLLAIRSGIGDIAQIVKIDENGKPRVVHTPGNVNNAGQFSVEQKKAVWSEYYNNPRWLRQSKSYVKIIGLETGTVNTFKYEDRLSGPVLDQEGGRVAAVKSTREGVNSIVIISAIDGRPFSEFSHPDNTFFSNLRWNEEGSKILAIRHTATGKTISILDVESGQIDDLLEGSHINISHPVPYGEFVLFNSPESGIDNIYALNVSTGEKYQVTSSRYGAYNPEVHDGYLYFNNYRVYGMDVDKIELNQEYWKPIGSIENRDLGYIPTMVEQEGGNILEDIPERSDPVVPYKQGKHLLNVYEWGPLLSTTQETLFIGATSRDVMSKMTTSLGYTFDGLEGSGFGSLDISYQGLYPILDFGINYGTRRSTESVRDSTDVLRDVDFKWRELGVTGGVRIPLRFFHSSFIHQVTIGNQIGLTRVSNFENDYIGSGRIFFSQLDDGDLLFNRFNLTLSTQLKMNQRDIRPKWGGFGTVESWTTPYGGDYDAGTFVIRGGLYAPGVAKHHSIFLNGGLQTRKLTLESDNYFFRNRLPYPRGHSASTWERMRVFASNYELPVWYPDIALGPILNIQRLRINGFYDYGYGDLDVTRGSDRFVGAQEYHSSGVEVRFDINLMRYHAIFDIGFRTTYLYTKQFLQGGVAASDDIRFELLLGSFSF